MQYVLGGSLHKNNTSCLLLGLYHASVNWLSIVLMQIPPPPPKWTVLWDRWKKRIHTRFKFWESSLHLEKRTVEALCLSLYKRSEMRVSVLNWKLLFHSKLMIFLSTSHSLEFSDSLCTHVVILSQLFWFSNLLPVTQFLYCQTFYSNCRCHRVILKKYRFS